MLLLAAGWGLLVFSHAQLAGQNTTKVEVVMEQAAHTVVMVPMLRLSLSPPPFSLSQIVVMVCVVIVVMIIPRRGKLSHPTTFNCLQNSPQKMILV